MWSKIGDLDLGAIRDVLEGWYVGSSVNTASTLVSSGSDGSAFRAGRATTGRAAIIGVGVVGVVGLDNIVQGHIEKDDILLALGECLWERRGDKGNEERRQPGRMRKGGRSDQGFVATQRVQEKDRRQKVGHVHERDITFMHLHRALLLSVLFLHLVPFPTQAQGHRQPRHNPTRPDNPVYLNISLSFPRRHHHPRIASQ